MRSSNSSKMNFITNDVFIDLAFVKLMLFAEINFATCIYAFCIHKTVGGDELFSFSGFNAAGSLFKTWHG